MSQPFIGEIRMVGFNFPPIGWATCDGQILSIAQNDVLFQLIGTTYGGDGQQTFALPNLAGRIPIHMGTGPGLTTRVIGELAGSETITLITNQLPVHNHPPQAQSANGNLNTPQNGVWAAAPSSRYSTNAANVPMRNTLIGFAGGSQPHDNMMPFVAINFIISLFGVFPSQT